MLDSRKEGLNILGILFNSCILDHRVKSNDLISLTCLLRDDSVNKEWLSQYDGQLKMLIIKDLDILFGVKQDRLEVVITKWENGISLFSPSFY